MQENIIQDKKYHLKQLYGKFGKVVGNASVTLHRIALTDAKRKEKCG
jgi:hypothetical protein